MIKILIFIVLSVFTAPGIAQLCTGSLGDPVVNITFGAGSNPGKPLPVSTTSYQYAANPCPVNGFYSLQSSGINCNYGWHILTSDHTGNPNGYFLLVDGSFEPGDFYLDTVKTLCANTTYEFASWMLNMKNITRGIRPNITFTIETTGGVVLASYNTGDLPVEQVITWRQYGFYFTTPSNISTIVLRMRNNAPGGDGNDLALDDITFRPCGPVITSVIQGNSNDTINICEGDTGNYTFAADASSGYVNPVYQWQVSANPGTNWNDIAGANSISFLRRQTVAGTYRYRVAVTEKTSNISACRIASNDLVINVHAKPYVNAGADRIVFSGDTIHLNAAVTGENPRWQWMPQDFLSDTFSLDPVAFPVYNIEYMLYAESKFGCKNNDAVSVKVAPGPLVPTAFSPNDDGINDTWRIPFLDPLLVTSVNVYNRWGQLVYHSAGTFVNWDGKVNSVAQGTGAYVYHIKFKKGRKDLKGTVILIR